MRSVILLASVVLFPSLASAQGRYERTCVNGVCTLRYVADPFVGYPLPADNAPKVVVPPVQAAPATAASATVTTTTVARGPLRRVVERIRAARPGILVPKRAVSVAEIVPYDSGVVIPEQMPQRPLAGQTVCVCTLCPRNAGGVCICELCPKK